MQTKLSESQMLEVARIHRALLNIANLASQITTAINRHELPLTPLASHEVGRLYSQLEDLIMRNESSTELSPNAMKAIEQECAQGRIS